MTKATQTVGSGKPLGQVAHLLLNMVILLALLGTTVWFAASYSGLRRAIQAERTAFVAETVSQIITSHEFMRDGYTDTILRLAEIVNNSGAGSLAALSESFMASDRENILLISSGGELVGLSGESYFLTDMDKSQALLADKTGTELFASLNNKGDHWLFSAPIEPLSLEGRVYDTIVLSVPEEEYRGTFTTSLYEDRGAAYVIREDGSVQVRPDSDKVPFGGFNLFSSLVQSGATEEAVAALNRDVLANDADDLIIDINGVDWLVNFAAFTEEDLVIVLVPLSITAAATYAGLRGTIVSAVCMIAVVAFIGVMVFMMFAYRDRERQRVMLAVEAKSDFFSKMSHDIRTPLNAIVGLQTLAIDKNEDAEVADYLRQSAASTQYLLDIINDVLEMSRIESGRLKLDSEPFDMNELLTDVRTLTAAMAKQKGVSFKAEYSGVFDRLYLGDSVRIKQVLVNVLNNAVKFTDEGGAVTLTVSKNVVGDQRDELVFTIADTGRGMSKEFMPHLFTPFDQERSSMTGGAQGSGLGLAIVSSLVELMQGEIGVESVLGEGSTFTVLFPLDKGEIVPASAEKPEPQVRFPGKRVLMAEDNDINQTIAVKLLGSKFALEVEVADDGRAVVEKFAASEPGYYDIILMDIKMPVMNGLEATKAIRRLARPDAGVIPILALSANTYREDVELSLAAGMNEHLAKPMNIEALSKAFSKYLG